MSTQTASVPKVTSQATRASEEQVRVCSQTGLVLVAPSSMGTWRVYLNDFGPLSGRPRVSDTPTDWNRFDLPGQATLYSSTKRQGAYAEVLAPLRPRIKDLALLASQVFDDVEVGTDPISEEWAERGHMHPGNVARIWHAERSIAQIGVPKGWYIDIEHPKSLQVLRQRLAPLLSQQGYEDMDVATIRGHDRVVTCGAAEWIASLYLDDGSVPLGIRYYSRHGTKWECWASFPDTAATDLHTEGLNPKTDADLQTIAQTFGLRFH